MPNTQDEDPKTEPENERPFAASESLIISALERVIDWQIDDVTAGEPTDLDDEDEQVFRALESVSDFQRAGMLSREAGLVLRFKDGSEYQITIVQSRTGR